MSTKKILVIMGTTRVNRACDGVANWIMNNLPGNDKLSFELVDLREWPLPFFDEAVPPLFSQGKYENEVAQKWGQKIQQADGFVLITAEYNHSMPAVLKNALDYCYSGWTTGKPVAFVSYGASSGGIRAVQHLRHVTLELGMNPLHDEVNIPAIWAAFKEDGSIADTTLLDKLKTTLLQFVTSLKV